MPVLRARHENSDWRVHGVCEGWCSQTSPCFTLGSASGRRCDCRLRLPDDGTEAQTGHLTCQWPPNRRGGGTHARTAGRKLAGSSDALARFCPTPQRVTGPLCVRSRDAGGRTCLSPRVSAALRAGLACRNEEPCVCRLRDLCWCVRGARRALLEGQLEERKDGFNVMGRGGWGPRKSSTATET